MLSPIATTDTRCETTLDNLAGYANRPSSKARSEVRGAMKKEPHACGRARAGEAAVSRENAAGGLFPHPATRLPDLFII